MLFDHYSQFNCQRSLQNGGLAVDETYSLFSLDKGGYPVLNERREQSRALITALSGWPLGSPTICQFPHPIIGASNTKVEKLFPTTELELIVRPFTRLAVWMPVCTKSICDKRPNMPCPKNRYVYSSTLWICVPNTSLYSLKKTSF